MLLSYKGPESQRKRWLFGCGAVILAGIALTSLPLGDGLAVLSYDVPFVFRSPITDTNVIVVLEDRAALDALAQPQWPPSRTIHASLLDRLREEGAKLVVFDIVFRNEKPSEDQVLAAAIRRHGNVILAGVRETSSHITGNQAGAKLTELKRPTAGLLTNAAGWGLVEIGKPDHSLLARRMVTSLKDTPAAIWIAAQRVGASRGEKPEAERWINFYGPPPAIDRLTLGEILQLQGQRLPPGVLQGKIVFVGSDPSVAPASGQPDLAATPFTRFGGNFSPGTEVLANACANLIRGDWLRRIDTLLQCAANFFFALAALGLLLRVGRRWMLVAVAVLFTLLLAATLLLQWRYGFWWNWLVPAAVQLPMLAFVAFVCPRLPVLAFISYRRKGGDAFALALLNGLRARGVDACLDVKDISSGEFRPQLLRMIDRAPNFVLILSPESLDKRIDREDDWLRKEICHAFSQDKRIIPVLLEGFSMSTIHSLPQGMQQLPNCQSIIHHHDQWQATLDQLEKYLRAKR